MHPVFNPVAPHWYLLPYMYMFMADIVNPDLLVRWEELVEYVRCVRLGAACVESGWEDWVWALQLLWEQGGGVGHVCLCCGGVCGYGDWPRVWRGGVMSGWVVNIVLDGDLRILGVPSIQSCPPYGYLLPNMYLFMTDIVNPDLLVCGCRTWICLDITDF